MEDNVPGSKRPLVLSDRTLQGTNWPNSGQAARRARESPKGNARRSLDTTWGLP
jgi:hypothetical protein